MARQNKNKPQTAEHYKKASEVLDTKKDDIIADMMRLIESGDLVVDKKTPVADILEQARDILTTYRDSINGAQPSYKKLSNFLKKHLDIKIGVSTLRTYCVKSLGFPKIERQASTTSSTAKKASNVEANGDSKDDNSTSPTEKVKQDFEAKKSSTSEASTVEQVAISQDAKKHEAERAQQQLESGKAGSEMAAKNLNRTRHA